MCIVQWEGTGAIDFPASEILGRPAGRKATRVSSLAARGPTEPNARRGNLRSELGTAERGCASSVAAPGSQRERVLVHLGGARAPGNRDPAAIGRRRALERESKPANDAVNDLPEYRSHAHPEM